MIKPTPAELTEADISGRIMAHVFRLAQPDRGDVFSWMDDHVAQIVRLAVMPIILADALPYHADTPCTCWANPDPLEARTSLDDCPRHGTQNNTATGKPLLKPAIKSS